jgi:hypothetical protein
MCGRSLAEPVAAAPPCPTDSAPIAATRTRRPRYAQTCVRGFRFFPPPASSRCSIRRSAETLRASAATGKRPGSLPRPRRKQNSRCQRRPKNYSFSHRNTQRICSHSRFQSCNRQMRSGRPDAANRGQCPLATARPSCAFPNRRLKAEASANVRKQYLALLAGRSTYISRGNEHPSSQSRTSIAASSNDSTTWYGKSRFISKITLITH